MKRFIDRIFAMEEIDGGGLCPPYMYRWTLLRIGRHFAIYLHKFVGDDWSIDLHDHPKRFVSIGLWGSYSEISPINPRLPLYCRIRRYQAPWIRTFAAEHKHRLVGPTPARPCYTLVVVGHATREWGFWPRGKWVPWDEYVAAPETAERRAC